MQEDGISFYLGRRKISLLYLQQIRNSKHTYLTHLIELKDKEMDRK